MWRYYYTIVRNIFRIPEAVKTMKDLTDVKKSNAIFIKQIVDVLEAKRLDKNNNRQAMKIINEVAKEVENGRRYNRFGKKSSLRMTFLYGLKEI